MKYTSFWLARLPSSHNRTASLIAACTLLLGGCTYDRHTPVNTRCGDLQISQNNRLVESNGSAVTVRRMPFDVIYAGKAQGAFRLHATSPNSPANFFRDASKDLWLVDSKPLTRELNDLRLAGFLLKHERSSSRSYDADSDRNVPQQNRSATTLPSDFRPVGRMDYNEANAGDDPGKRLMRVTKVQGQPLPGSKWPVLHLTSLVGALAPPSSEAEMVTSSACTVFFE